MSMSTVQPAMATPLSGLGLEKKKQGEQQQRPRRLHGSTPAMSITSPATSRETTGAAPGAAAAASKPGAMSASLRSSTISFTSPFASAPSSGGLCSPSLPREQEALSPYCRPSSPWSTSSSLDSSSVASSSGALLSPPESTVSSSSPYSSRPPWSPLGLGHNAPSASTPTTPSPLGPGSSSSSSVVPSGLSAATPASAAPPFERAFAASLSLSGANDMQGSSQLPHSQSHSHLSTVSPPVVPRPSLRPAQRPSSTLALSPLTNLNANSLPDPDVRDASDDQEETIEVDLTARRRSVCVASLVKERHRTSVTSDCPKPLLALADEPTPGFKLAPPYGTRESLFAEHLSSILAHSLSLCAAGSQHVMPTSLSPQPASVTDDDFSSPGTSPRSSISSTDDVASLAQQQQQQRTSVDLLMSPTMNMMRAVRLPSLPSITPLRRLELIHMLEQWSFDANELDQDELCECACIIFESAFMMEGMPAGIEMKRLRSLLLSLRSAYHSRNAYHNFAHAVDVLQACYAFLTRMQLAPPPSVLMDPAFKHGQWHRPAHLEETGAMGNVVRPQDVFALLIAAIGHDVGHPGLSNAYMVNAKTPAAQIYNDKSVLENFHSVTLARMLKLHGFGHLLESPDSSSTDFRQVMLASVLATDMSRHFPFVGRLTEQGQRLKANNFRSENIEEDRLLMCSGLMKCADISNPTRPHKVAAQWSTALLEEWSVQAQIERKFKLPVSVVVLNPTERVAQAKSQVGFINLFTQPLFDAMASVDSSFMFFADACREGRMVWESIVLSEEDTISQSLAGSKAASPTTTPRSSSPATFPRSTNGVLRPLSGGFSSRLPPHRAPRTLKQIDANRANATYDSSSPKSAGSLSSDSSPKSPKVFDRNGSVSSSTSASSWLPPSVVDDHLLLGEEECPGNCSLVTACCAKCSRKFARDPEVFAELEGKTPYGSPTNNGIWPPTPFRPRRTASQSSVKLD